MLTLQYDLWGLMIGLALFSYWLNYCMGSPLATDPQDVDTGAILFFFPNWLAWRRLRHNDLAAEFRHAVAEDLLTCSNPETRLHIRQENRRDAFARGRLFFTWERSLLCPICFHWWLTVLVTGIFLLIQPQLFNLLPQAALAYLVAHLLIRKIS